MSIERYTDTLAAYLPNDRLFASKFTQGSNLRSLLRGAASLLLGADESIAELRAEYYPATTTKLIEEWEALVGIPDDCFTVASTIEERRLNVMIKLVFSAVQTLEDFQELMEKMGVTVSAEAGSDAVKFPLEFPILLTGATSNESRFTIVLLFDWLQQRTFPHAFPLLFGGPAGNFAECIARKVAPANVQLIFKYAGPPSSSLLTEDGLFLITEDGDLIFTE